MTLDKAIERYTSNAEYERTHGNLQGCLDFRQLAEWLKDYKRLLKQEPKTGYWKKWEYGTHRCSICDKFIGRERYPYCPYCGAKMVEPQESNDKCKNCEYYRNPDYTRCHECKVESEEGENG